MAFTAANFIPLSASANDNAGKVWLYKEAATLAAMRASGYFNDAAATYGLEDGDVIMLIGSDAFGLSSVTVTAGVVAVDTSLTAA